VSQFAGVPRVNAGDLITSGRPYYTGKYDMSAMMRITCVHTTFNVLMIIQRVGIVIWHVKMSCFLHIIQ